MNQLAWIRLGSARTTFLALLIGLLHCQGSVFASAAADARQHPLVLEPDSDYDADADDGFVFEDASDGDASEDDDDADDLAGVGDARLGPVILRVPQNHDLQIRERQNPEQRLALPAGANDDAGLWGMLKGWGSGVSGFFSHYARRGSAAAVRSSVRCAVGAADAAADEIVQSGVAGRMGERLANASTQVVRPIMERVGQELNAPATQARVQLIANGVQQNVGTVAQAAAAGASKAIDPIARKAIIYTVVGVASVAAIGVTGHYLKKYISDVWFVPDLVTSRSEQSYFTGLSKKLGFGEYRGPRYSDLILTPETRDELDQYFSALISAKDSGFELPSLLLYGPPGTAKSEVARRMAKESGFNFAFMSGSSFSQFSEEKALEKMSELLKWANKSGRKTLVFVDEADSIVASRNLPNQSEKSQKLLTHLLHLTDALSPNFTMIYASNRPEIFDEAMNRRITFQVEMANPDRDSRIKIARYYFEQYIGSEKKFVVEARIDDAMYETIADHTDGLSGAYIEELWKRVRGMAFLARGWVTDVMISKATLQVEQKAKKKQAQLADAVPAA